MEGKLNEKESDFGWSKDKGASPFHKAPKSDRYLCVSFFFLFFLAIQVPHVQICFQ